MPSSNKGKPGMVHSVLVVLAISLFCSCEFQLKHNLQLCITTPASGLSSPKLQTLKTNSFVTVEVLCYEIYII